MPGNKKLMSTKTFNLNYKKLAIYTFAALLVAVVIYEMIDVVKKIQKVRASDQLTRSNAESNGPMLLKQAASVDNGSFRFLVFGDSGTGQEKQKSIARSMERRCLEAQKFDAILLLGDVVYPDGVTSTEDPQWQSHYEASYRAPEVPCLSTLPVYPVLGNHDHHGDITAWIGRAESNPLWRYPGRSWRAEFGDVATVFGMDSNFPWLGGTPDLSEKTSADGWRIAMGHHPLRAASDSGGRHKGGGIAGWQMKKSLCGLVDFYLAGHAHHLEYAFDSDCEQHHIVSGAAGANIQGVDLSLVDPSGFAQNIHGFVELLINQTTLQISFVDAGGELLHEREIVKAK